METPHKLSLSVSLSRMSGAFGYLYDWSYLLTAMVVAMDRHN